MCTYTHITNHEKRKKKKYKEHARRPAEENPSRSLVPSLDVFSSESEQVPGQCGGRDASIVDLTGYGKRWRKIAARSAEVDEQAFAE
jgi:hypothetical protein